MAERVYLHIGAPKTGTTFLQDVLLMNRQRLARKGIWYVGERWSDHVHARLALVEHPRLRHLDPDARAGWSKAVAEVHEWSGHTAIMSHELFGSASQEQAARAIRDLSPAEVHLVFTARPFTAQLPAIWQEQLKWRGTTRLSQWRPPDQDANAYTDWSWRTMDPVGVLQRWGAGLDSGRVHVIPVPKPPAEPEVLWERFAAVCGIPAGLCDTRVTRTNKSLGAVEAELLRRVNVALGDSIQDRADVGRWVRHFLAHTVLVPRGGLPMQLRPDEFEALSVRARESRRALTSAGYDIVGDLDDLAPPSSQQSGIHPDDVAEADILDAATDTIATMLLTLKERTEERDAAREKLKVARGHLGRLRARSIGPLSRVKRRLVRGRDVVRR